MKVTIFDREFEVRPLTIREQLEIYKKLIQMAGKEVKIDELTDFEIAILATEIFKITTRNIHRLLLTASNKMPNSPLYS